jgi:hypothetical protein
VNVFWTRIALHPLKGIKKAKVMSQGNWGMGRPWTLEEMRAPNGPWGHLLGDRAPEVLKMREPAGDSCGDDMRIFLRLLIALSSVVWVSVATALDTKVIINLSEQRAYLVEEGQVTLISGVSRVCADASRLSCAVF